jgi:hypothetical protein
MQTAECGEYDFFRPMATYPTKLVEQFAAKVLQIFYQSSITEVLTNQDYQGQIENKASILNILTLNEIGLHTYNGNDMIADSLDEWNAQLKADQAQYIYFTVKDYDTFRSYIKDPESTVFDGSILKSGSSALLVLRGRMCE